MKLVKFTKILFITATTVFLFIGTANADSMGQKELFFIDPQFDPENQTTESATLRHISDRAYFYIADNHWDRLSDSRRTSILNDIGSLAAEFDNRIYPIERQFFGSEPNPGIDNNPRITLFLTNLIDNAGGYYDTTNQYSRRLVPQSNEREIIYLNVDAINEQRKIFGFLAHEFQHMISYNEKELLRNSEDDIWLNELRSEYAVTLLGYNDEYAGSSIERRLSHFIKEPYDSLTEWKNLSPDYAHIALFGQYLAEQSSLNVIAGTLKNNLPGIRSINESLKQNGFNKNFLEIYGSWLLANIVNDRAQNPAFGFSRDKLSDFTVKPNNTLQDLGNDNTFEITDILKDWSPGWHEIFSFRTGPGQDDSDILKIEFNSSSLSSFRVIFLTVDAEGTLSVEKFEPSADNYTAYFSGVNERFNKIVIMPFKKDRLSGFGSNEVPVDFIFSLRRLDALPDGISALNEVADILTTPAEIPGSEFPLFKPTSVKQFPNGSLIRARGDVKVYVINDGWRRHIVSPEIFNFYPHLGFDKVIEVEPDVINSYKESRLIRYALDKKVYEIENTTSKRWLNITPEQFSYSGRSWDSIFIVNDLELKYYKSTNY